MSGSSGTPAPPGRPALGADFVAELRKQIPHLIDEVVELLQEEAPDYAVYLASEPEDVYQIAEEAVQRLVAMADDTAVPERLDLDLSGFVELGRMEWREGRSLRTLLAAYRAGARVAWRHLADTAIRTGVSGQQLAALAEAIFAFIDELSAASARGYAEEQSRSAGEMERRRLELADLLLAASPDVDAVEAAALRLGYPLPAAFAVVLAPDHDESSTTWLAGRLGSDALPVRCPGLLGALVPDPDGPGRRAMLRDALAGWSAVVGWATPWPGLAASYEVAELAVGLVQRGTMPSGDPTFVDEHLGSLLVQRDPVLLAELTERRLAPLAALPDAARGKLLATLRAWLDAQGERQAMARALHVHPQTIRYRMGQLRSCFGDALDDPQVRFELSLVVRGLDPKP